MPMWSVSIDQPPGPDLGPQRAGGVGQQQRVAAQGRKPADQAGHLAGRPAFVEMGTGLAGRPPERLRAARERGGRHARRRWAEESRAGRDNRSPPRHRSRRRAHPGRTPARCRRSARNPGARSATTLSTVTSASLPLPRSAGPKEKRQQLGHGLRQTRAVIAQHVHRDVGGGKLVEPLPAAAAGGAGRRPAADHRHLDDPPLAGRRHGADRRGLGALPLRIGGVLDIAPRWMRPLDARKRGTDAKAGIGRIRGVARRRGRCKEVVHRSFT